MVHGRPKTPSLSIDDGERGFVFPGPGKELAAYVKVGSIDALDSEPLQQLQAH